MSAGWKVYRIVCALQMMLSAFMLLSTATDMFRHFSSGMLLRLLLFLLITLLSVFAINVLTSNYPDTPVTGTQKTTFNRLFLLNFLFLAVLFGLVIAEFRVLNKLAGLIGKPWFRLPAGFLTSTIIYSIIVIFQFIILYGLYNLRRLLYANFMKREFEFEKETIHT